MGIYYYLNHPTEKKSFELNKGANGWQSLEKTSAYIDREALLVSILVEMNDGWAKFEGMMAYALWLRDVIWDFKGNAPYLIRTSDAGDMDHIHPAVMDRFPKEGVVEAHFKEHYDGD